ncbi:MAG: hypothetical protein GY703_04715 [Gammaproteobacteria bacterium]|nr:hypothetical protein [Gammaproteobacteria bacterium]
MSNIAGKAYAMNVVTPAKWYWVWVNKLFFWFVQLPGGAAYLKGLLTLSLIHYARWAIVSPKEFPHLDESQPKEKLKYSYMFFFSNFNGSWDQYVDSFHAAIPQGLDLFWFKNVKYPKSVPLQPFHAYITYNQIWTSHYYSAYPLATSNDIKSARHLTRELRAFSESSARADPLEFHEAYQRLLRDVQQDISIMERTPIVSLSAQAVEQRLDQADAERADQ